MKNIPFEKSFASHEKAKYWSVKNKLQSNEVSKGSDKKFYFNCDTCNHEFLIQLFVVSRGGWCNYCSNTKLCENNECIICYNKSFASNDKAKYWSNKNELIPRQVFKVSAKNIYLIVINVIMNLLIIHHIYLMEDGVHIVAFHKNNYVEIKIVRIVIINLLLHMKKQNIGQIKMNLNQNLF